MLYVLENEFKRAAQRELGSVDERVATAAKQAALGCMQNMSEIATAVGADASDAWLANKYLSMLLDFEDTSFSPHVGEPRSTILLQTTAPLLPTPMSLQRQADMLTLMSLDV